jgi:hypothetical protein
VPKEEEDLKGLKVFRVPLVAQVPKEEEDLRVPRVQRVQPER